MTKSKAKKKTAMIESKKVKKKVEKKKQAQRTQYWNRIDLADLGTN